MKAFVGRFNPLKHALEVRVPDQKHSVYCRLADGTVVPVYCPAWIDPVYDMPVEVVVAADGLYYVMRIDDERAELVTIYPTAPEEVKAEIEISAYDAIMEMAVPSLPDFVYCRLSDGTLVPARCPAWVSPVVYNLPVILGVGADGHPFIRSIDYERANAVDPAYENRILKALLKGAIASAQIALIHIPEGAEASLDEDGNLVLAYPAAPKESKNDA